MADQDRKNIEAQRAKRQAAQTAAERYADHQADVGVLLDLITEELRVHAEAAVKKPTDWGFAGDIGRVRQSMKDVLGSLLIGRYEWSETETSRFIEDHLEDLRNAPVPPRGGHDLADAADELLLAAYGAANQLPDGNRYRTECLAACEKAKAALARHDAKN